jgi:hypothetical protein
MEMLDKGMIHVLQDCISFYHATQNDVQFKIYELFISGIFHLIFSDHSWPQVTETPESKTPDERLLQQF